MTSTWYEHVRDRTWTSTPPSADALQFHQNIAGYSPTSLVDLPELADELGVGRVVAKDESSRLGLPAFKSLGASWALHRLLEGRGEGRPVTVVTATDGNHGRAIARWARVLGHHAHVIVPSGVHPDAIQAICDEGAQVMTLDGTYDDAVGMAKAVAAGPDCVLVQDTAWDGYERIPGWIVEGYSTLFIEMDEQLQLAGAGTVDLVVVPVGVGSLLQAAITHYRQHADGPAIMAVESDAAAFLAPSLANGEPVAVAAGTTIMAGLNCGTPSSLAWPMIERGLDAAVAVGDDTVLAAASDLAALGVPAGPCGAAGLAAMRIAFGENEAQRRRHLGLNSDSLVMLIVTEGVGANPSSKAH